MHDKSDIDMLDRRLIALLQADARRATAALAADLGVPRTTVHERIERLERRGVIVGYTAVLARNVAYAVSQALVLIACDMRRQPAVVARLGDLPEVRQCLAISGEYGLFALLEAPLNEDIEATLEEIAGIEGVESCRSYVVFSSKIDRTGAP